MTDLPPSPDLGERLGALATAVEGLRQTVEDEHRARRAATWILGAAIFVLLVGGIVSFNLIAENRRQNDELEQASRERAALVDQRTIDACRTGNEARASTQDGIHAIVDALAALPPATPRTPEEQARFAERVAGFRADLDGRLAPLGPRDCSPGALGLRPFDPDDEETSR